MAVEEKFGLLKRLHGPVASLMVLLFVQGEIASVTDFFSQLQHGELPAVTQASPAGLAIQSRHLTSARPATSTP
jgi:hypothetical protein